MEHFLTSEGIISFFILVILEIVLGIDNVIFVSIILNKLATKKEEIKARRLWMITGILSRSLLLFGLSWLLQQNKKGHELFVIYGKAIHLADIVMIIGGVFLIYKSVMEIHSKLEGEDPNISEKNKKHISLYQAIGQIILIDAVFSFDSIITAGGTAKHLEIMIGILMMFY